jgi:hypothetical protein
MAMTALKPWGPESNGSEKLGGMVVATKREKKGGNTKKKDTAELQLRRHETGMRRT